MRRRRVNPSELAVMTATEAAAFWLVHRDRDPPDHGLSDEDSDFKYWLGASIQNRTAYDRAQAIWQDFEAIVDPGELGALRSAALAGISRPRRWRALAAVGAVCLAALAALFWFNDRFTVSIGLRPPNIAAVHYESARHEPSSITLADGTIASLDADSAADVSYSEKLRLVTLRRGRAFFDVAKNPNRPFVVVAADRRVTALGTRFQVWLGLRQLEVVLAEGSASVERSTRSWADFLTLRNMPVVLRQGQRLSVFAGEPVEITHVDADKLTSWRNGWLVFEDEPLAHAVAALNRYATSPIVVPDETVGLLRLSGVFLLGQPERFVALIQELLPVTAVRDAEGGTQLLRASMPEKR